MNILTIDDEQLSHTFIQHVLENEHTIHTAMDGMEGIRLAREQQPELIILDVRMPNMDGYQVCEKLKEDPQTAKIPVLFLSANTSLTEQMQGYSAGGDDYLIKPCKPETLRAKVTVMLRYAEEQQRMKQSFQDAQKTAHIAMVGSSEIGMGMQFLEKSYLINDYSELAKAFFEFTDKLQLTCAVMFFTNRKPLSFFSDGSFSPLEEELLEKMRNQQRIFDFGPRTFINYPNVTLLIKNMPIDDQERYGRIKDLLPTVLGGLSNKLFSLMVSTVIQNQSEELVASFDKIKTTLLSLGNSLSSNHSQSIKVLQTMMEDMCIYLPKLALEEDQESYILNQLEKSIDQSLSLNDSADAMQESFKQIIDQMKYLLDQQRQLIIENQTGGSGHDDADEVPATSNKNELF